MLRYFKRSMVRNIEILRCTTHVFCACFKLATGLIRIFKINDFRAAAMTLRTVLLSIQALLGAAEPDDPQDAVVAKQYKENPDIFNKTARHWTSIYASGETAN